MTLERAAVFGIAKTDIEALTPCCRVSTNSIVTGQAILYDEAQKNGYTIGLSTPIFGG